jgi:hypothetical protein
MTSSRDLTKVAKGVPSPLERFKANIAEINHADPDMADTAIYNLGITAYNLSHVIEMALGWLEWSNRRRLKIK